MTARLFLLLGGLLIASACVDRDPEPADDDDATDDDDSADVDPCPNPEVVWPDLDDDGFGNFLEEPTTVCDGPIAGEATNPDDCNDADPLIHPDADEVCDGGIDNDCDGLADDASAVDPPSWYPDVDSDGFGDPDRGEAACLSPADWWVEDATDCDDLDVTIHPGTQHCGWDVGGGSCLDVLEAGTSLGDGMYVVDPDGDGGDEPVETWCDMTTDGGGWTALLHPEGTDERLSPGITGSVVELSGTSPGGGCAPNPPFAGSPLFGWNRLTGGACGTYTAEWTFTWPNRIGATEVRFVGAMQGQTVRTLEINGNETAPTAEVSVDGAWCAFWNGAGASTEPARNDCADTTLEVDAAVYPFSSSADLILTLTSGPAASPTDAYHTGWNLHRLMVR